MNIPEILVANGTGAVLVSFLLLLRVRGESKNSVGTELFCRMLLVTLLARLGRKKGRCTAICAAAVGEIVLCSSAKPRALPKYFFCRKLSSPLPARRSGS